MNDPRWTPEERAILDARTATLARPFEEAREVSGTSYVRVVASGERFAIAAAAIRAVAPLASLSPVPLAPPQLAGLVLRGGELVPAFDLRVLLGLPLRALPERARIVILDDPSAVALVVDGVDEARLATVAPLDGAAESLPPLVRELVIALDDEGTPILDARALLASPQLVVDASPPDPV